MHLPKILITGPIPAAGVERLRQHFAVTYDPELTTRTWVLQHLAAYEGLLLTGLQADRELIAAGTNLKIITTNGVGFDHVDVDYARNQGIVVTNCPQSVRQPTAEMTLALLLATVRRLHFYDHNLRMGKWPDVDQQTNMGMSLAGKVLGIYGMGRIGTTVAQLAQAFGMRICYHNRQRLAQSQEEHLNVEYVDFDTLVQTADVLTLHAPATPATTGVFNAAVFAQMKRTAYLINVARGALVQQDDLITALQTGAIAGAGLDVYATEPQVPPALLQLDNVILTPHAGTGTVEARTAMALEAARNLEDFFQKQQAPNQVNPSA